MATNLGTGKIIITADTTKAVNQVKSMNNKMVQFSKQSGLSLESGMMKAIIKSNGGMKAFHMKGLAETRRLASTASIILPAGFNKAYMKMNMGMSSYAKKSINKIGAIAKKAGSMAMGAVGMGTIFSGFNEAKKLGEALRQIHVLDVGADMKEIKKQTLEMSYALGVDASKAAEGYYQALSASGGKSKEFTQALFKQGMALSQIASASGNVVSVGDAIKALGGTVNAFGGGIESISTTSSALFNSVKNGITDIGALAGSLSKTTGIASSFGMTIGELSAMLAIMTKKGVDTAAATTGINAIMSELAKGTSEAGVAFGELGLGTLDQALKSESLIEILARLKEGVGGNDAALFKMFGNIRGSKAALSLLSGGLKENIGLVNKFKKGTNDAGAALTRFKNDPATKFSRVLQMIKNVIIRFIDAMGGMKVMIVAVATTILARIGAYIALGVAKAFAWNPIAGGIALVGGIALMTGLGALVGTSLHGAMADSPGDSGTIGTKITPTAAKTPHIVVTVARDELGFQTTQIQQQRNGSKINNVDSFN